MNREQVYALIEIHYKDHAKNSMNRLRMGLGSIHNAEDTVQEAYLRALTYWKAYDASKGFDQWFSTILSNCIRDTQRNIITNGMVQEDLTALAVDSLEFDMTDHLLLNEIKAKINSYPTYQAHILRLYILEGYTSRELADVTDQSAEAIRKMVSRFKETLYGKEKK